MHLLVLMTPQLPPTEDRGEVEAFLKYITSKQYSAKHLHPSWNKIRPREIRLFDFTIPEKIEKEVIADLQFYEGLPKLMKLPKLMSNPILMPIAKKILGIQKIERGEKNIPDKRFGVYVCMLGKVSDEYLKGVEQI